jgi:hypothetical protein
MASADSRQQKVVAFILSGIFPGLGQFYNRQHAKGIAFLVVGAALFWLMLRAAPTDSASLLAMLGDGSATPAPVWTIVAPALVLLVVWLWSVIDAWRAAGR